MSLSPIRFGFLFASLGAATSAAAVEVSTGGATGGVSFAAAGFIAFIIQSLTHSTDTGERI
jgi:hypothetical protein